MQNPMVDPLLWLLNRIQDKHTAQLSQQEFDHIEWGSPSSGQACNWLKTDSLFLTVVSKQIEADELTEKLLDALTVWKPSPHRLLVSHLRNDLEANGGMVEDTALKNNLIQAGLLESLLEESDSDKRKAILGGVVSYLWEGMLGDMEDRVLPIAEKIVDGERARCNEDASRVVQQHFNLDLNDDKIKEDVALNLNAYRCSISPSGWHLTTGHVLQIEQDYFVCLTPACDLVPGQRKSGWYGKLKEALPVKIVKLFPDSSNYGVQKATEGRHLFLEIEGSPLSFCFFPDSQNNSGSPHWEQVFALNFGQLGADRLLKIGRVNASLEGGELEITEHEAVVISQLRYEYALNLLHRLGSNLSRVGLDFVNP